MNIMDNIVFVAIVLSIVALFASGYAIITRSNKKIREEKDPEIEILSKEANELGKDFLD